MHIEGVKGRLPEGVSLDDLVSRISALLKTKSQTDTKGKSSRGKSDLKGGFALPELVPALSIFFAAVVFAPVLAYYLQAHPDLWSPAWNFIQTHSLFLGSSWNFIQIYSLPLAAIAGAVGLALVLTLNKKFREGVVQKLGNLVGANTNLGRAIRLPLFGMLAVGGGADGGMGGGAGVPADRRGGRVKSGGDGSEEDNGNSEGPLTFKMRLKEISNIIGVMLLPPPMVDGLTLYEDPERESLSAAGPDLTWEDSMVEMTRRSDEDRNRQIAKRQIGARIDEILGVDVRNSIVADLMAMTDENVDLDRMEEIMKSVPSRLKALASQIPEYLLHISSLLNSNVYVNNHADLYSLHHWHIQAMRGILDRILPNFYDPILHADLKPTEEQEQQAYLARLEANDWNQCFGSIAAIIGTSMFVGQFLKPLFSPQTWKMAFMFIGLGAISAGSGAAGVGSVGGGSVKKQKAKKVKPITLLDEILEKRDLERQESLSALSEALFIIEETELREIEKLLNKIARLPDAVWSDAELGAMIKKILADSLSSRNRFLSKTVEGFINKILEEQAIRRNQRISALFLSIAKNLVQQNKLQEELARAVDRALGLSEALDPLETGNLPEGLAQFVAQYSREHPERDQEKPPQRSQDEFLKWLGDYVRTHPELLPWYRNSGL